MGTIVSYMADEQRTFAESPFTPADSLVLSTLAYLNYEASPLVSPSSHERVLLHDVIALGAWDRLACHSWMQDAKDTRAFLHMAMASRRLRDVRLAFYANERADAVEKQFSAVTLFLPAADGEEAYLAFRGTDGSLAGWKEDFNLCFKDVIPSQRAAGAYLSGVASACGCPLRVGGHSKGGNLAEFAALTADEGVFARIRGVYNHDGPSFLDDPSPRVDEPRFQAILDKTVPESSAFGMILERRADYRVVQSSAVSVFQHEPFTWQVEGGDFVCQDALNRSAVFFDEALDTWLRSKTPEERERFIDTIYDLVSATKASTLAEFQDSLFANVRTVAGSGTKLDDETKRFIVQTMGSLVVILRDLAVQKLKPSAPSWLKVRREPYRQGMEEDGAAPAPAAGEGARPAAGPSAAAPAGGTVQAAPVPAEARGGKGGARPAQGRAKKKRSKRKAPTHE